MSDTSTEKIYCMDSSSSLNPMLSALLSKDNAPDAATMALLGNNQNQMWNNPFSYIMMMWLFRMMNGNGWGDGNGAENFNSRQIATLQDTVANNHNNDLVMQAMSNNQSAIRELAQTFNTDIGNIQIGIAGIQNAISTVGGQVGMTGQQVINSVLLGNKDIIQQMCSCCCENKQLVQQMGYEGQLRDATNTAALTSRIDQLANGIQSGFAQVGYAAAQNTSAIMQNATANTQKILDALCNQSTQALRDELADKDRDLQTQTIINQLRSSGCSCNS